MPDATTEQTLAFVAPRDDVRLTRISTFLVPCGSSIRNNALSFDEMTASLVVLESNVVRGGRRLTGYGFTPNGRYGQHGLLTERFLPRLRRAEESALVAPDGNLDPFRVTRVLMVNEKPGGHGDRSVAVGAIDMAVWDLVAKIEDLPLYELLADRYGDGTVQQWVPVYAAGGYYGTADSPDAIAEELRGYRDAGFTHVKIKAGGAPTLADDVERIEAALEVFPAGSVAVDSNAALEASRAFAYAEALGRYALRWWEEPCDPLDYELCSRLRDSYGPPIATGENVFSVSELKNLLRYAGLDPTTDFLQMDPPLACGLVEFLQMVTVAEELSWQRSRLIPHGGHQFALDIVASLGLGGSEFYPRAHGPFGRVHDDAFVRDGRVYLEHGPGIGIEANTPLYELFQAHR